MLNLLMGLMRMLGMKSEPEVEPAEMSRLSRMRELAERHESHGRRKFDLVLRVRVGSLHSYYTPPPAVEPSEPVSMMDEIARMRGFLSSRLHQTSYQPMTAIAYRDMSGSRGF